MMDVNTIDTLPVNEKGVCSSAIDPVFGKDGAETLSEVAPRTAPSGAESADDLPLPPPLLLPLLLRVPPLLLPPPLPSLDTVPPMSPVESELLDTVPPMSPVATELVDVFELSVPVTSEALAKDTPIKAKATNSAGT
jgi:hypothetical protein